MISSNAKPSFSMTESTVAPSYYSDNDKYTPDDSYLYQTETGTINSPSSPPSCSSSLRPLIAGTGASLVNTLQNQPPSRQQKLVDFGRRMGLFGGKKEQERSSGMPYLMNGISVSTTSTVTFDPTPTPRELEGGRGSHDHGRSGRGRQVDAEAGLEEIPLDWSPRSLQATPPIYVSS
ncbi:hypothetical protein GYMLUDRAFT_877337 [Collybiopsis luxurians FD-317 M1]|nr:hypothetical protein GYMLUDRAFT_877337 [Collybiopsis luxurians FD-317 M1]